MAVPRRYIGLDHQTDHQASGRPCIVALSNGTARPKSARERRARVTVDHWPETTDQKVGGSNPSERAVAVAVKVQFRAISTKCLESRPLPSQHFENITVLIRSQRGKMPAKSKGVYQDKSGLWYFKVDIGNDPLIGRRSQLTKRGFRTAAEAARD